MKNEEYIQELRKRYKVKAKDMFANHVATMKENDDVIIIDWKEPGSDHVHCIRYLFEKDEYRLIISGDFGDCTVWNGYGKSNICIEKINEFFDNPDYFCEKVKAHQSNNNYVYNEYLARLQLEEELSWLTNEELANCTSYEDVDSFIGDIMGEYDSFDGFRYLSYTDIGKELESISEDLIFVVHDFGKTVSPNIYLYLKGLHMAMQQLQIGVYKS